ncbi:glycosyltransferase [Patescibacteria group bacterium AH-259-L07]|nr:glycosyltransferase [Patescibacteria group bacterium AH-259-L07]
MAKKKILHLITGLEIGGAEYSLLKTIPTLEKEFNNLVCAIKGHGVVGKKLAKAGVSIIYLDVKSLLDIGVIKRYRRVLKQFQPDLQINYLIHADLFGRIFGRIFRVPKIISFLRTKLLIKPYLLIVDKLSSGLIDHYFAVSQAVKTLYVMKLGINPDKLTVIPNGVELKRFQLKYTEKNKIRKTLNLDELDQVMIYVARLQVMKGHDILLQAIYQLRQEFPRIQLLLVGDGKLRPGLENFVTRHQLKKHVLFLGSRLDIPEVLSASNIFVFPTLYEGMPNALLEAMAAQLPIVATDIEENRELIRHRHSGLLVKPKNPHQLAGAIKYLLTHPKFARQLGYNARQRAQEKFDIQVTRQRLLKAINKQLNA